MPADGVPPLPRLPVTGRHTNHWVMRGVSVNGDDAPASSDAPRVAPHAAVSIRRDPVVGRLGAVGASARGGATLRGLGGCDAGSLVLGHGYYLKERQRV